MARNQFATKNFLRDQIERAQQRRTKRRQNSRSHRRRIYFLASLALIALLILGAPSIVSHSPLGPTLVSSAAAKYGLTLEAKFLRIGWVTPLRLSGVRIQSESAANHFRVGQIDSDLTIVDLLSSTSHSLGEWVIRGVDVHCTVRDGRCSVEDDFQSLLDTGDEGDALPTGRIQIQDILLAVTDSATGNTWQIAQSNAEIDLQADAVDATFSGLLTEPGGNGGSLQGKLSAITATVATEDPNADEKLTNPTASADKRWQFELQSESVPLSVVTLIRRRFPEAKSTIPSQVVGDATGSIRLAGFSDGAINAVVDAFEVHNLQASDPKMGNRIWSNQRASVDGRLTLTRDRVIGQDLRATTDFASATLDGAFSRSLTLTGVHDNPIKWLEAIDGTTTAEIDLASFEKALPGVLPLRDRTQIVSGRATAKIDSLPTDGIRRSRLSVQSDALRARASGRVVVIEPIEFTAVVSSDRDVLKAEHFRWDSSFATAVGKGDLRSGSTDFEVDFGRLAAMLRPIVEMSGTELGGAIKGKIRWDATQDDLWRLTGSGNASNLQVTLMGGQTIQQNKVSGKIDALGRWGGQTLEELSEATLTLYSSGLDLRAELKKPVRRPTTETPIPMRIEGQGRIESLANAFAPWIPEKVHDAEGRFDVDLQGDFSTATCCLTNAAIELTQPRIAYDHRWFSQPNVKVHFDGRWAWPSGDFEAKSFTLAGDAVSAGVRGSANAEDIDLEIAWRAKLERIQSSVQHRIAYRSRSTSQREQVRPVAFRSGATLASEDWLLKGDFSGKLTINRNDQIIEIATDVSGEDFALIEPSPSSTDTTTVDPSPLPRSPIPSGDSAARTRYTPLDRESTAGQQSQSRVVWSEPELSFDGIVRYDTATHHVATDAVHVAGQWLATTLSGQAVWDADQCDVTLEGPARIKMRDVGRRLSSLAGTRIQVEGIHETPLKIHVQRVSDGTISLAVDGLLGWESGEVAGVQFGPASVPLQLSETSVKISPSVVPVGKGQLNLAGEVFYRPEPVWIRLQPGVVAQSVRLTPAMSERWLKYIAPPVAHVTSIDGVFGAEIEEATIVLDSPEKSRVVGRLNIEQAQMTLSPMMQQMMNAVKQLKSLARSQAVPTRDDQKELITMPAQTVDFDLDLGIVTHKRIFLQVDKAQVVTSGEVALDGRLNMIAQVPLDAEWLGSDLQGLSGQVVSMPISGTIYRPQVEPTGIRNVVSLLTPKAVQDVGDTFLRKQLERSETYIEDQLNRGLDKMGLDKLFGR